MGARDEFAKERYMEIYKEYIYKNKKGVNEQFGRKMNEDVDGNRKLHLERAE